MKLAKSCIKSGLDETLPTTSASVVIPFLDPVNLGIECESEQKLFARSGIFWGLGLTLKLKCCIPPWTQLLY